MKGDKELHQAFDPIINPISHRLKQHSRTEDPIDDLPDNEEDDDFVLDEQGDPLDQSPQPRGGRCLLFLNDAMF